MNIPRSCFYLHRQQRSCWLCWEQRQQLFSWSTAERVSDLLSYTVQKELLERLQCFYSICIPLHELIIILSIYSEHIVKSSEIVTLMVVLFASNMGSTCKVMLAVRRLAIIQWSTDRPSNLLLNDAIGNRLGLGALTFCSRMNFFGIEGSAFSYNRNSIKQSR